MTQSKFKIFKDKLDHLKVDGRDIVKVMSVIEKSSLCGEEYLIFKAITVKNGVKKPYELYMKKCLYENFDKQNILKIVKNKQSSLFLNEVIFNDNLSQEDNLIFYEKSFL